MNRFLGTRPLLLLAALVPLLLLVRPSWVDARTENVDAWTKKARTQSVRPVRPEPQVTMNAWTVGLAGGLIEGAPIRLAAEIARVIDDGDNLHVLPVVTRGATENVNSLLYLRGIDAAIINSDVLDEYKGQVPDIQRRLAYVLTGDPGLAEDLAQEAFSRLIVRLPGLRNPDAIDAYLRRSIVNLCRKHWRRLGRERAFLRVQGPGMSSRTAALPDIAGADALRRELARLPYRQRAALVLRFFEDLSEKQAARAMGCAVAAAEDLVIIGDTPLDVDCARAHGARAIGVTTGPFTANELAAAVFSKVPVVFVAITEMNIPEELNKRGFRGIVQRFDVSAIALVREASVG